MLQVLAVMLGFAVMALLVFLLIVLCILSWSTFWGALVSKDAGQRLLGLMIVGFWLLIVAFLSFCGFALSLLVSVHIRVVPA